MSSVLCAGLGARWSNVAQPLTTLDDFAVIHVMIMLIVSSVIYMALTLYFECIMPTKYGITRPWYFIFKVGNPWKPILLHTAVLFAL